MSKRSTAISLSDLSSRTSYQEVENPADNPFDDSSRTHGRDVYNPVINPQENPLVKEDEAYGQKRIFTEPSLYNRYVTDSWGLEIAGWLAATLMLAVLVALLGKYNNHALSEWKSRLSLNTIIAVLSQLIQACLLLPIAKGISQLQWLWYREKRPLEDMAYFDDGSRGIFDSLVLLSKRYTSILVWLGVIPMVLQAFIGPFAQQALSLPERQIHRGSATIPRVLFYDSFATSQGNDVTYGDDTEPDVSPSMRLAIATGLQQEGISHSEVKGYSSTGNSSFDPFTSMGVCASVEDVSSTIITDCQEGKGQSGDTVSDDKCNATVQGLRDNKPYDFLSTHMPDQNGDTLWVRASKYKTQDYRSYQDSDKTLLEFYVIYLPDLSVIDVEDTEAIIPYGDGNLQALKGTLSLCAYTFNSSIEFGVTTTSVLKQDTDLKWGNGVVDMNGTEPNGLVAPLPDSPDTLFMDPETMTGINALLEGSTFDGTAQMKKQQEYNSTANTVTNFGVNRYSTLASKAIAIHLYNKETMTKVTDGVKGLSELLDNVAISMTNSLRTSSIYPLNQTAQGTTYEVYFDVSWPWLIVPILSVPLTILFLGIVIFAGRRHHIPAWKTSTLASLQALNPNVRAALGDGISRQSEMNKRVIEEEGAQGVRLNVLDRQQGKWELGS